MSDQRIPPGRYKARGIEGSEQYGASQNGTDQIAIDLELQVGEAIEVATTFLFFSERAAEHSIRRLRALGWDGVSLLDLRGIGHTEAEVTVSYEMWDGSLRMKVQIFTGDGRIVLQAQMSDEEKRGFQTRWGQFCQSDGTDFPPAARPSAPSSPSSPRGASGGAAPRSNGQGAAAPAPARGGAKGHIL